MKIKVISCSNKILWYSSRIGEVFEVCKEEEKAYWCREGGQFNCLNWIQKTDAEVIKEKEFT
jgi:hypothetical protein